MSSSDEEVFSPQLGQSSSNDLAPVTPNESESECNDLAPKNGRKYRRPRVKWVRVLSINKGVDAEMDYDQINFQVLEAARAFMDFQVVRS